MRILFGSTLFLALVLGGTAAAQQSTSVTRSEVTAIRAKLVAVQQAMGADPAGYVEESEDFNVPTHLNSAKDGKFWPDLEAWAKSFDYGAMLGVIDPQ